ncbi:hypothetical protein ACFX14_019261 [Malus domestica]
MIDSLNQNYVNPQEKGVPLPKFGEWDVNDPVSAEGFTVIFNKARIEKKTGGRPDSPSKKDRTYNHEAVLRKPPSVENIEELLEPLRALDAQYIGIFTSLASHFACD